MYCAVYSIMLTCAAIHVKSWVYNIIQEVGFTLKIGNWLLMAWRCKEPERQQEIHWRPFAFKYFHPHKNDVRVTFERVLFCPQTTTWRLSQVAVPKANLPISYPLLWRLLVTKCCCVLHLLYLKCFARPVTCCVQPVACICIFGIVSYCVMSDQGDVVGAGLQWGGRAGLLMSATRNNENVMPFANISNFELALEIESVRTAMQNKLANNGFNEFLRDYHKDLNLNTNVLDVNGQYFDIDELNHTANKKSNVACSMMHMNIRRISKNRANF